MTEDVLPVKRLGPDGKFGWYMGDRKLTNEELAHLRTALQDVVDAATTGLEKVNDALLETLNDD